MDIAGVQEDELLYEDRHEKGTSSVSKEQFVKDMMYIIQDLIL